MCSPPIVSHCSSPPAAPRPQPSSSRGPLPSRREFRRGISPWVFALYRRKPALLQGTAYWSVSPPATAPQNSWQAARWVRSRCRVSRFPGPKAVRACQRRATRGRALPRHGGVQDPNTGFAPRGRGSGPDFHLEPDVSHSAVGPFPDPTVRRSWAPWADRNLGVRKGEPNSSGQSCLRAQGRSFSRRRGRNCKSSVVGLTAPAKSTQRISAGFSPRWRFRARGWWPRKPSSRCRFHEGKDPVLAVNSHFFEFQDPASGRISLAHEVVVGEYLPRDRDHWRRALPLSSWVTWSGSPASFKRRLACDLSGAKATSPTFLEKSSKARSSRRVVRRALAHQGVTPRFFLLAPAEDAHARKRAMRFSLMPRGYQTLPRLASRSGEWAGREFPLWPLPPFGTALPSAGFPNQPRFSMPRNRLRTGNALPRIQSRRYQGGSS